MTKIIDLRRWRLFFVAMLLGGTSQLYAATAVDDDGGSVVSDGSTVSVPVLSNDTVAGTFSISDTSVTPTEAGTVNVITPGAANGDPTGTAVNFTPTAGFAGQVIINYTLNDNCECSTPSSTAAITIDVTAPIPFQAVNDTATSVITNGTGAPVAINVLANDSYDHQSPVTVSLSSAITPANAGTASVDQQNQIVFTPAANFSGVATLSYAISNARQQTSSANITVNVQPAVTLQANNDAVNIPVNPGNAGAVRINVLANDTFDPQFIVVTPPSAVNPTSAGTVAYDQQTREVLFTPAAHYRGTATFTYQISDGVNQSSATINAAIGVASLGNNPLLNPEELRAAQVLDTACATASGALENSCAVLEGLSAQDQQKAIEQILPNQVPAQLQGAFLQQDQQLSLLRHRLSALRAGAHGVDVSGLNIHLQDNSMALGQALQSEIDGNGSAGDATAFADTPWGLFLSGRINRGKVDTRDSQKGFDFRNDILAAGIDYRKSDRLVLGSALSYSATSNDLSSDSGDLDLKSWMLSFYGNYYPRDNWYVDWIAGYSHNAYDGKRHLQFGSIDEHAKFDSDGKQYSANLTTGYDWSLKAWQVGSYVRADYVHSMIDGYTESDTAGLALQVAEQQARSVETALGGRFSYSWSYSKGVLIPGLDVEYVHQWQKDQRFIAVALADSPSSGTFGIATKPLDANYFNIGMALTSVYTGGKSAFIRFETITGRQNVRENNIEAGFRMEF